MRVLFSPSEAKSSLLNASLLHQGALCFEDLYDKRLEVMKRYEDFFKNESLEAQQKLTGMKLAKRITPDLLNTPTCKAIERYSGVAYQYLAYETLDKDAQTWIDAHVLIFSNLLGPLLAKDTIPPYKLKQGEAIGTFRPETFYKTYFSDAIDAWLAQEEVVLDLRAGFYEKFYTLKQPHITMKFLKKGKVVSHFAKAYRGSVLRRVAQYKPLSEASFGNIPFDGLCISHILHKGLTHEYVYEIVGT